MKKEKKIREKLFRILSDFGWFIHDKDMSKQETDSLEPTIEKVLEVIKEAIKNENDRR